MRNHLPFRCVIADADGIKQENLAGCTTLIVPGAKLLSDKVVKQLQEFDGRLIVIGDECGDYDENYSQRAENPFAGTEKIAMPEHRVPLARFRTEVQYVKDDWRQYFPGMPEVSLNSESVVDFKCDAAGVISGVLISSPVVSGGDAGYAYVCLGDKVVGKVGLEYAATVEMEAPQEKKPFWRNFFGE